MLRSLADLLLESDYEEGKSLHYEKLANNNRISGADGAEYAQTLSSLANVHSVTGNKQIAEKMHRETFRLTRKSHGDEHPYTAAAMLHPAITISGDAPEAEALLRRTLNSRRKFFGAGHIETAWAIYYLCEVFLRRRDYQKAVECADEILSWHGNSIPETH